MKRRAPSATARNTTIDDHIDPQPLLGTKLHIVQAKLDATEIEDLFSIAEASGAELCSDPVEAEVVVTNVRMRKRLERHLKWEVASKKTLVTPSWLHDSVSAHTALPCGDYAAIADLKAQTVQNCPDGRCGSCSGCVDTLEMERKAKRSNEKGESDTDPGEDVEPRTEPKKKARVSKGTPSISSPSRSPKKTSTRKATGSSKPPDPDGSVDSAEVPAYTLSYACQRRSPLTCPNDALVKILKVMRKGRELEGEERSALSYARAIAAIKSYPCEITDTKEAGELPFVGTKITAMIKEFLETGQIAEAHEIATSERYATLSAFTSIHGIGPSTARKLYASGLRTFAQVERYYEAIASGSRDSDADPPVEGALVPDLGDRVGGAGTGKGAKVKGARKKKVATGAEEAMKSNVPYASMLELVRLRDELGVPIPRDEVEEITRVCVEELEAIMPGCIHMIGGSHRRGKAFSSDVDLVFTGPESGKDSGLCKQLVERLHAKGIITHNLHLTTTYHVPSAVSSTAPISNAGGGRSRNFDNLEKALVIFKLPPSSASRISTSADHAGRTLHRRVDLIFAPVEVYWTAVVGWTGSTMFERDLRLWSKDKCGIKFDSSGMVRQSDGTMIYPRSERAVFETLGLEWIDPEHRNADA